ncbi:hypothetical protein PP175_21615 [Aneurinibacillus sp. Ricciae_BoGa-3]|nr:hypothetical protein [Aneurinibacillus sp. Ricciae_BoGa-3]WCK53889.1 hypothetical protein PP175_21615 [Aneurinibacillus sp. Ricciae_BoGa-3]
MKKEEVLTLIDPFYVFVAALLVISMQIGFSLLEAGSTKIT